MTIGFIHEHKAFLPELNAYADFFAARGIQSFIVHPSQLHTISCDVEWHFMGRQVQRNRNRITIHEYCSASVPPFGKLKDSIKKLTNAQPDYRIFNSEYVRQRFNFTDAIPFGFRDCGIPSGISYQTNVQKQYDFVYVGTIDKSRNMELLFDCFTTGALKDRTLLVLTRNYQLLDVKYKNARNIIFKGPIPFNEVYAHIQEARFAINYMPNVAPFNQQASAKFLDYAACGIPVVTSDYHWVRSFQHTYGGHYFYLQPNWENFTWENINSFTYAQPDLNSWTYEKQIFRSGVLSFLESKFSIPIPPNRYSA
ncbi:MULTISPECIES: glycosyltransferase family protein [Niastella]|uniref:Glycosyl transferase family 1 domain-containing protein n=1 Tax=Niastella soli TaxID=2821487 RepID=A0ABS3YU05_9BACT|nr:hypothetical protein [Niastella soli]MBO9201367.1 hypothetical protein [Niastella soli]